MNAPWLTVRYTVHGACSCRYTIGARFLEYTIHPVVAEGSTLSAPLNYAMAKLFEEDELENRKLK